MSRFAVLATALVAAVASVSGSPVATNGTAALAERDSQTGRVSTKDRPSPFMRDSLLPLQGTWYNVGLGACGYDDVDTDYIVAISKDIYGDGSYCNEYIRIENTATGDVAYGQTRDKCMGCAASAIGTSSPISLTKHAADRARQT